MTDLDEHYEIINLRIEAVERDIKSLKVAVFEGDQRTPSMKDRIFTNEMGLTTVKESINAIADIMREHVSDKKKLMWALWGGAITYLLSALGVVLMVIIGS